MAERIILLADTCHSAAIGAGAGSRGTDNAILVNRYLEEVGRDRPGMALLTSAESAEVALEHERWGGRHGVFTYYLLQGMKGEADLQDPDTKDGVVTVGELFDFVRQKVKTDTDGKQHPSIGQTPFDRNLPMAITGGATAHELYRLGSGLYELGRNLADSDVLRSAEIKLRESFRMTKSAGTLETEAILPLGKTLMALGEWESAAKVLGTAVVENEPDVADAETLFLLSLAYGKLGHLENAEKAFGVLLDHWPGDERALWIREVYEQTGKQLAPLVAIDGPRAAATQAQSETKQSLNRLASRLSTLGFDSVKQLLGEEAHPEAIHQHLTLLAK